MLAVLGLAGAGVAGSATVQAVGYSLVLSAVFLGRAHYLIYVRKQGRPWTRWTVWGMTALVVALWLPRLV